MEPVPVVEDTFPGANYHAVMTQGCGGDLRGTVDPEIDSSHSQGRRSESTYQVLRPPNAQDCDGS